MRYSVFLVMIVLVGCGQKGDLYLPNDAPDVVTPTILVEPTDKDTQNF